MHEIWFPLKGTGGMDAASEYGILSVTRDGNKLNMLINALQQLDDKLTIKQSGNIIKQVQVKLKPLESKTISISIPDKNFTIELVNNKLFYSSNSDDNIVERPTIPNSSFNWESAYGLYTMALELEKQRKYNEALRIYHKVILKDAGFKPALNRIASGYYRLMEYSKALKYVNLALSIDTYDAEANYIFGLINNKLGNPANAKSGFSIASSSVQYRVAGFTELAKIFIRERSYSKALHYTEKALAFNNSNPIAFHLQAIAYRKINRVPESKLSLEKLIALDATWHSTRFEFFMLDNSESTKSEFIKRITNELPAETFLDMAIEYHNLNLTKEAIMILGMAPEHPVVNLWLAYLDSDNTDKHLKKALAASPYLVFPFRNETAEILKQFNTKVNHWKLKYYLGLIYWNRGLESETRKLFNACGDTPDYAPFYLAQAKLNTDSQKRFDHLTIARDLAPDDWRTALALINYYLGNNRAEEAVGLSKEFTAKYPEQSAIGLSYARALMNKGDYQKAVNFLQKYDLLPFEGATAGRDIYHESCVRMAIKAISEKSYRSAIKWAAKAREWPVNLGVGRSYDVDERLEDFIVAYSLTKLGNQNRAATYYMNIVRYKCKDGTEEGAKLYLQLLALQKLGKEGQAKQLVAELTEQFPNNLYIKWAAGKIKSEEKSNELKQTIKNSNNEIQPYDTKFVDREFDLLMEFLEVL
jgi:tetratricopeptide (TPR) repeat protein